MLLGTPEIKILRGSIFCATWTWKDNITDENEDFEGLSASIKIKNIHEEFEDIQNTFEVGIAEVEPIDDEGNASKGSVKITLSKEDTLLFKIPANECDRYGESGVYGILNVTLSTGEVIIQAKVTVIESLESEDLTNL